MDLCVWCEGVNAVFTHKEKISLQYSSCACPHSLSLFTNSFEVGHAPSFNYLLSMPVFVAPFSGIVWSDPFCYVKQKN